MKSYDELWGRCASLDGLNIITVDSSSPNTSMFTSGMKAKKNLCEAKHVKYLAEQGIRLRRNEPQVIEGEDIVSSELAKAVDRYPAS